MVVKKKKKKKKEEFDASLMGGYLPGVRKPIASIAPQKIHRQINSGRGNFGLLPQTPILVWNPHSHEYGVEHEHWEGGLMGKADPFIEAWAYYGFAGIADPGNLLEAAAYKKQFGIPLVGGMALASVRGFVLTGLFLTLIDPADRWGGGTDEVMRGEVHPTTSKDIIMGLGSWGSVV
jgi:hypothetical protein